MFALELGSALVDTNNVTANYQWAEFAPQRGFAFRVLEIVFPNGYYSKWGTLIWILHSTWAFCYIILAHTPAHYIRLITMLHGSSIILIPVALGYALHQVAYLIVLVSGWKEPVSEDTESHHE